MTISTLEKIHELLKKEVGAAELANRNMQEVRNKCLRTLDKIEEDATGKRYTDAEKVQAQKEADDATAACRATRKRFSTAMNALQDFESQEF